MQQRLQKSSLFIYYGCIILTFICIVCFMTDYYALFIYGTTSEMSDFYADMQIFNKEYYSSFILIIVASVLLPATGITKKAINKIGIGYIVLLIGYVISTILKYNGNLNVLKSQYMSFDLSGIDEVTYSLTWINALNTMGILTILSVVILGVAVALKLLSKTKG